MSQPEGKDIRSRLLSLQRSGHRLQAVPMAVRDLPRKPSPQTDIAVLCHGRNREDGSFDWLYAYLPNANANDEVLSAPTRPFLQSCGEHTVPLAGLCPADPFHHPEILLDRVMEAGFRGVHNFPSTCLLDGSFRSTLEQNHMGFHKEVNFMKLAVSRGVFTFAMVSGSSEALLMRNAGVQALVLVPGVSLLLQHDGLRLYREECQRTLSLLQDDTLFFCCWPDRAAHAELAYFLQKISGFYSYLSPEAARSDG